MPSPDDEFFERLRATFKVEAEEHLQTISASLLTLEKSPATPDMGVIEIVYREAHSLKGAARAVDMIDIESVCQVLESVFRSWKLRESTPSPTSFDVLHKSVDAMRLMVAPASADRPYDPSVHKELISALSQLLARNETDRQSPASADVQLPIAVPPPVESAPETVAAQPVQQQEKSSATETVRIPIAKLDARLLESEEMLVTKLTAAQRATELRELAAQFEQWHDEWAKVSADVNALRHAVSREDGHNDATYADLVNFLDWNDNHVRSLENKITTLAALAEQDRHVIARRVDNLLEQSKQLLMLPFSTLAGIFPRVVRDLCREDGKAADVELRGGEVEIDKRVLDEMKDALLHLLRNCVAHGLEQSDQRTRLDKPPRGQITITAAPINGSKVEIRVSDDGRGIDLESVKRAAVTHGAATQAEVDAMSDHDALNLIFHSDVSTSRTLTSISGRGLGMAIVREKVERLAGKITIESRRDAGTTFCILLPLTLTTFRGILISLGDRTFVVPTTSVERVLRLRSDAIKAVENRETISVDGRPISLVRLDVVLNCQSRKSQSGNGTLPVMVLQAGGQHVAFAVDEVLREQEVLVKPLPWPLVRLRNVAGATLLASGQVVPVLNATDLIKSARLYQSDAVSASESVDRTTTAPSATTAKRILVAEDSITSRMLLKGILESAGYKVTTALDGIDAFTKLREDKFDLLVSDIEMPRLNGFGLTARVRADATLSGMPVVLVTALESRDERERGIDAGASAYIIKSTFDQSNLLEVVRRLI